MKKSILLLSLLFSIPAYSDCAFIGRRAFEVDAEGARFRQARTQPLRCESGLLELSFVGGRVQIAGACRDQGRANAFSFEGLTYHRAPDGGLVILHENAPVGSMESGDLKLAYTDATGMRNKLEARFTCVDGRAQARFLVAGVSERRSFDFLGVAAAR